ALARRCERVALEIEFDAVLARDRRQCQHVVMADVARVRTRMHGDAVRAGIEAGPRGADHVGIAATTRVAQHRDLVEVDAEPGHAAALSMVTVQEAPHPRSPLRAGPRPARASAAAP